MKILVPRFYTFRETLLKPSFYINKFILYREIILNLSFQWIHSRKNLDNMEQQLQLNDHNKQEHPPMHTAEHILNQTMVRMFGCERSKNTHIEKKKSKCDYYLSASPSEEQMAEVERKVNEVIGMHLPVTAEFVDKDHVPEEIDLSKLPENVSQTLRIVRIGSYDTCACIGRHVANTAEIGIFKIISYDMENQRLRIRFKLLQE